MTTIQCPVCQGRKTTLVHYNYSNRPHEWREDPCRTCNGTGAITEEQAANRDAGRKIYEARVALNLSLKDFSVLSKVDYARQSKIENDITEGSAAEIILIKRALKEAGRDKILELKKKIERIEALTFE